MSKNTVSVRITALYERLSRDDEQVGESNSILNQKKYLEDFAAKTGLSNIRHFTDDGYSGVNFNRPGIQELIREAEAGKIETVVVKDMSRFGRNYLEVGYYTEILFPQKNVRFIAVNNNIDSTHGGDNDFVPFLNIMNEWYAKDTSNKIKAIFNSRMKDGKRCSGSIPFGYNRISGDKQHIAVDPVASETVKRVFLLADEGKSEREIAAVLTAEKTLIPAAYEKQYHPEQYNGHPFSDPYLWTYSTVRKILERQEYLGHTVLHKTVSTNFKLHKRKDTDKADQFIFPDTHEAIISKELWDSVLSKKRHATHHSPYGTHRHRLSGYLYCADCGKRLTLQAHYGKKDGRYHYDFRCGNYANVRRSCTAHGIRAEVLESLLLTTVQRIARRAAEDEVAFANELKAAWEERQTETPEQTGAELKALQKRFDTLTELIRGLYENMVAGLLPQRQYKSLMEQYDAEQAGLESKIENMKNESAQQKKQTADIAAFLTLVRKYKNPTEITDEMLEAFVDKIVVHEATGKGGDRRQEIDIHFNFIGYMDFAPTEEEITAEREKQAQDAAASLVRKRAREKAYREKRKAKRLAVNGGAVVRTVLCGQCGNEFAPTSNRQLFCSASCRKAFHAAEKQNERETERGNHLYRTKACIVYGNSFWPQSSQQKCCSDDCRRQHRRDLYAGRIAAQTE